MFLTLATVLALAAPDFTAKDLGLQLFTALPRQGVPSRLVMFPAENHWVLKAENSVVWYDEVLGWLTKWAK